MFDFFIKSFCIAYINTTYYGPCNPTLTAASIQYKVKSTIDDLQKTTEIKVQKKTGNTVWYVLGTYYSYTQNKVQFKTTIYRTNLSLESDTKLSNNTINLQWNF